MRHLSLFTGAGGGELGAILNGWHTIGYVEFNDYCQRVLKARIEDGILPEAPIFGDIKTFISDGYASSYQGLVDVISGGFPCQPFSVAGKQKGADDERNMWPATIECVRIIKPRYCFFENVRGLLGAGTDCDSDEWGVENTATDSIRYFGTILRDLSDCGYAARWKVISAAEVGAPHKRDRLWIMAHSNSLKCRDSQKRSTAIRLPFSLDAQDIRKRGCESPILGDNHGVADRVDRLKAIGDGQVPSVVRAAWEILS